MDPWQIWMKFYMRRLILVIDSWSISWEIVLRWMSLDRTVDDKSRLVQVMAWCRQAGSHYLSRCWPRSLFPYGITGPQWFEAWIKWQKQIFWGNIKMWIVDIFHITYYILIGDWSVQERCNSSVLAVELCRHNLCKIVSILSRLIIKLFHRKI